MKKFLSLAVVMFQLQVCLQAQTFKDPVSYMNHMSQQYKEIMKQHMSYTSTVAHSKSARKAEAKRKSLIQTVKESKSIISKMPPYQGDKNLRDSVVAFLNLSYIVLTEDYGKIINLEEVAEQSYDAMEAYMLAQELAENKLDAAAERMDRAEHTFAEKHHVKMIENEDQLAKKIKVAAEVNNYHKNIYLIFFKNFKQESYLSEAVKSKNINSIEQNRNTLISYATEGLAQLDTISAFKSDKSLKLACTQLLNFYLDECNIKTPQNNCFLFEGR